MPPKVTDGANSKAAEGSKFTWEGLNDYKLLLLTQGRYVKTEEYEQLASDFLGATIGSIRNRISVLRVKQRNMYEERGWELPEGGAGHSPKKAKSTPSKRAYEDRGPETPSKKLSALCKKKKNTKPQTVKRKNIGAEDDEGVFDGAEVEPQEV